MNNPVDFNLKKHKSVEALLEEIEKGAPLNEDCIRYSQMYDLAMMAQNGNEAAKDAIAKLVAEKGFPLRHKSDDACTCSRNDAMLYHHVAVRNPFWLQLAQLHEANGLFMKGNDPKDKDIVETILNGRDISIELAKWVIKHAPMWHIQDRMNSDKCFIFKNEELLKLLLERGYVITSSTLDSLLRSYGYDNEEYKFLVPALDLLGFKLTSKRVADADDDDKDNIKKQKK